MSGAPLIAIVDDDELARDGIRELVESFGYAAATFTSAEGFLQSAVMAQAACLITTQQFCDNANVATPQGVATVCAF